MISYQNLFPEVFSTRTILLLLSTIVHKSYFKVLQERQKQKYIAAKTTEDTTDVYNSVTCALREPRTAEIPEQKKQYIKGEKKKMFRPLRIVMQTDVHVKQKVQDVSRRWTLSHSFNKICQMSGSKVHSSVTKQAVCLALRRNDDFKKIMKHTDSHITDSTKEVAIRRSDKSNQETHHPPLSGTAGHLLRQCPECNTLQQTGHKPSQGKEFVYKCNMSILWVSAPCCACNNK
jgi:hypothetical protein